MSHNLRVRLIIVCWSWHFNSFTASLCRAMRLKVYVTTYSILVCCYYWCVLTCFHWCISILIRIPTIICCFLIGLLCCWLAVVLFDKKHLLSLNHVPLHMSIVTGLSVTCTWKPQHPEISDMCRLHYFVTLPKKRNAGSCRELFASLADSPTMTLDGT